MRKDRFNYISYGYNSYVDGFASIQNIFLKNDESFILPIYFLALSLSLFYFSQATAEIE